MREVLGPRSNTWARGCAGGFLLLVAVCVGAAFPLWQTSTWATAVTYAPPQPAPFSHAHHVSGLGIDCRYCHTSFEESSFAGMPPTETCMGCHLQLYTTAPLLEPVRSSWRSGRPLAWRRVHDLPDFVYFDHAVHVDAGVSCLQCHGEIQEMPLTWQSEPLSMTWCLDCHRDPHTRIDRETGNAVVPTLRPSDGREELDLELLTDCTACHR